MSSFRLPSQVYRNLDFLRAFAVLAVYGHHLARATTGRPNLLWSLGHAGVLLFFVHTCLVLMQSLERSSRTESVFLPFYARRFFRIYPLAIFCIVVVVVLGIPASPPVTVTHWDIAWNLALAQNLVFGKNVIGPLWSLPFEVQMYVMLPFLFLFLRNVRHCRLALGLSVLFAILQPIVSARASVLAFLPCFMPGVLAYRLPWRRTLPAWMWLLAVPSLAAAFCAVHSATGRAPWTRWVFCAAVGVLIPRFQEIQAAWITRPAAWIAKYSYGIYLSHEPLIWFVFRSGILPPILTWPVLIVGSAALPIGLYHGIEHPMIQIGKRLTQRAPKRALAAAA